jgi:hypothetical protein
MPPSLAFGFIMCTYLPGIPITILLYHILIEGLFSGFPELAFKNTFIVLYVAVSPLIFGLLFDAGRHSLEHLNGYLSNRNGRISSQLKKGCVFWSHWDHLPVEKLKIDYEEDFIRHIINIYAVQYHMYEFFYNLALSSPIALIFFLIWKQAKDLKINQNDVHLSLFVIIIVILSVIFGWVMNKQNKTLINEYFPKGKVFRDPLPLTKVMAMWSN